VIGKTLSHYHITAAIGTGGMGAVYRATDSTLGRDVAIKVLAAAVANDAYRLARFKREAHLLAALNHPHIAAIYGFEEAEGTPFLALELVEGEDLKQRLARGALPLEETLEVALQIAEALEEAHNKGIVHRDLKPANVKLTPDGKVKVLDFGLAKAWAGDVADGRSSSPEVENSPTMSTTGTLQGVILGTAGYMSPEQARGKPVDRRADVWAFGVLLWEMLTGDRLFSGGTVTDVIAAVLREEPDLDALPRRTPPALRRLIARCLRKDPRTRLPDIGAARIELQDLIDGSSTDAAASAPELDEAARRRRARERGAWLAVTLALGGLSAFLVHRRLTAPDEPPPVHFAFDTPENLTFSDFDAVALSPDGRHVAYVASSPEGGRMWIRSLDAPDARVLPGTSGALGGQFWSPDSASIAFPVKGELHKLALTGETVQRICAFPREGFNKGTWSRQGTIVFSSGGPHGRLYSVSDKGGEAKPLTTIDASREELFHHFAQFLPDDRHFLFQVSSLKAENRGLFVASLDAPDERRRIRPEGVYFQFAPPGYLLFLQSGTLLAQRFDAEKLVTTGDPLPLASSVASFAQVPGWGSFSASATGRIAWLSSVGSEARLDWVDRTGRRFGSLGDPASYGQIVLSPDGRRVVAEIADADGRYDLWTLDVARGVPTRLTSGPANDKDPVWSPDSREIIFSSDARGDQDLLRKGVQGLEPPAPLPRGIGQMAGERYISKEWVREGNTLLYLTLGAERVLWAASLDGSQPPEAILKGSAVDQPHVSPDGRWLAYISTDSGRLEVYVQPFRRQGERLRVSANGGGQPKWRADGKELFYLGLDGALMGVTVGSGPTGLALGMPQTLVPATAFGAVLEGPEYNDYAVTADGQRFLVKRPVDGSEKPRIHVLLDWPSMLRAKSSAGR
jgi:eukaryotic-like serine/threonine-protein kinase